MLGTSLALALAAASPPAAEALSLVSARHAIEMRRFDQARNMIAAAIAHGARGPAVDRLMAELAFASGRHEEALARYETLLAAGSASVEDCERAGIAALKLGRAGLARTLLARATAGANSSWKAWNARAVAADLAGDWDDADSAYAKAQSLAPRNAEVANNRGWSLLLRGRWEDALTLFEQAAELDARSDRVANNLELARAAIAHDLPVRAAGESAGAWAARLNDAGVAAAMFGQKDKAVAAFTRALEARSSWYGTAASNLAQVQKPQ